MTVAAMTDFIAVLPTSRGQANHLPDKPVVYFVLDQQNIVRYVGATISLRKRWCASRKNLEIMGLRNFRVAWVNVHPDNLATVEDQFMRKLQPSHNRDKRHRYPVTPTTNSSGHR
jgi:excinuclease UvrABC nuclease subunit